MRSELPTPVKISDNQKRGLKSCRKWRHHLVEAVCHELTEERRDELDTHLASCPGCSAELAGLQATTRHVDGALPAPPQGSELNAWSRLQPELDKLDRPAPGRLILGYPAAASLAAALLVLGLGLGTLIRPSGPDGVSEDNVSSADLRPTATPQVEAEFVRYLERATPLLLAVANRQISTTDVASFDPAAERRLAEHLASEAEELGRRLEAEGRRRQADLTANLRIVFLQMANLPRREYRRGIEMVQATIESRALLFQLSVEEMRHL